MAERLSSMVVFVVLSVAASLRGSSAATHVVGDSLGWAVPPTPSTYSNWASSQNFSIGDTLVFTFTTGQHDVTEVTKAAFDSCRASNPISVQTNGPARITLSTAGDRHFICGFPGHCSAGQKLSITVKATSSPAPQPSTPTPIVAPVSPPSRSAAPTGPPRASPSTGTPPRPSTMPPTASPPGTTATPPPVTAPPPRPNSASSLGVFSFLTTVLAIAIALVY